jgi:hypothetical protein
VRLELLDRARRARRSRSGQPTSGSSRLAHRAPMSPVPCEEDASRPCCQHTLLGTTVRPHPLSIDMGAGTTTRGSSRRLNGGWLV